MTDRLKTDDVPVPVRAPDRIDYLIMQIADLSTLFNDVRSRVIRVESKLTAVMLETGVDVRLPGAQVGGPRFQEPRDKFPTKEMFP